MRNEGKRVYVLVAEAPLELPHANSADMSTKVFFGCIMFLKKILCEIGKQSYKKRAKLRQHILCISAIQ